MSRFGTGLGFNIQDIALISGIATEIFNANVSKLDGITQRWELGDPVDLRFTNALTISAWVNPTNNADYQPIIARTKELGTGAGEGYRIGIETTGKVKFLLSADGSYGDIAVPESTSTIPNGSWSLITGTYDGVNAKLYVNGVLESTVPWTSSVIVQSSAVVRIGFLDIASPYDLFIGDTHSPLLTNRALIQEEETARYNAGVAPCWDVLVDNQPSLADVLYTTRLYNHVGDTGNELVNQGTASITTTNIGATPFTGSAQIECED